MQKEQPSEKSIAAFLALLKVLVGNGSPEDIGEDVDWQEVYELSCRMKLPAVVWGSIRSIYDSVPDARLGLSEARSVNTRAMWMRSVVKAEARYRKQNDVLGELGAFYAAHGLGMMLLKGQGLSLHYPVPKYRTSSDIDCFLFYLEDNDGSKRLPAWKLGDMAIGDEKGIKIDNSVHHHSEFRYEGVLIENHYDFINVHSHKHNREIEARFKELAAVRGREILPGVFLPSPNLEALFVIRHAAAHFAATELTFRQILDWVLLVKDSQSEIDWVSFWKDAEMMGMEKFVRVIVDIAERCLGFDRALFHLPSAGGCLSDADCASLSDKVLQDVFSPGFAEAPSGLYGSVVWRFRRWRANRWKHRMVYKDSLLSTFFHQVGAHMMKPGSLARS